MRFVSTPKPCSAARASPESLSRTRLKAGVCMGFQGFPVSGLQLPVCCPQGWKPETDLLRCRSTGLATLIGLRFRDRHGLSRIADLEARKAAYADVFPQLANFRRNELRNRHGLVLDERLLQQADFLVELLHF